MPETLTEQIQHLNKDFSDRYPDSEHKVRLREILRTCVQSQEDIEEGQKERILKSYENLVEYIPDFRTFEWNQDDELGDTLCALMAVDIFWYKHVINTYAELNGIHNNLNYFILSQFWSDDARESVEFFFDQDEEDPRFYYLHDDQKIYL